MVLEIFQVDAFTDRAFAGNPAAVCPLPEASFPEAGWMQALAAEMNLSETAFLMRQGIRADRGPRGPRGPRADLGHRADVAEFGLRWFTPAVEVELCGHATLASAHVLWEPAPTPA